MSVSRQKPVHILTVEGASKVTNGAFATDTGWTKGAGWMISSGRANKAAGAASDLSQAVALTSGGVYLVEYALAGVTAGSVRLQLTGGTAVNGANRTTDGTYSETLTAAADNNAIAFAADAAFVGRLDNVSVRRVG